MWMWSTGINRNIVECKDGYFVFNEKTGMGINRNIVECKVLTVNQEWVRIKLY